MITLNKPVNLQHAIGGIVPSNQTDYTGEGDFISLLRPLQRGKEEIVLKKKKGVLTRVKEYLQDPVQTLLREHGTETLNRLPSE